MSVDLDDLVLEPISLDDVKKNAKDSHENTLADDHDPTNGTGVKYFSVAMGLTTKKRKREPSTSSEKHVRNLLHWKHAILKARCHADPWEKFHLDIYPTEKALRHRYNALKKAWHVDEVVVKMEPTPFANGAMRECFRMKKLSNFSHNQDWCKDSNNAVAKQYMTPVDREVYFDEVKLQMDAKLWGEEYNRHHPPKQVDIVMMAVLEFVDRPDKPLFHVENFIEGHYVKYNSNSGFVLDDEAHRTTPQAFSHFTFERSGHELIVVDIQGVGDLYTDPQIHTVAGTEYGSGNLGTRGMALYFHSHVCNAICESLGLSRFDLSESELHAASTGCGKKSASSTVIRGNEEICLLPNEYERSHLHEFLRMRSSSSIGSCSSLSESIAEHVAELEDTDESNSVDNVSGLRMRIDSGVSENGNGYNSNSGSVSRQRCNSNSNSGSVTRTQLIRRPRLFSESNSNGAADEADRLAFRELVQRKARASCVEAEVRARQIAQEAADPEFDQQRTGGSVLGQIHLDLAKYHELQRFTQPGSDGYDHDAALFHLRHAADCGNLEAIITVARVYLELPHDVLPDIVLENTPDNVDIGLDYLHQAAAAGDRASMIYLAKAYDTGDNLGTSRVRSWTSAVRWYSEAVAMETGDEEGNFDATMDDPTYQLVARQAEMYRDGGFDLTRDTAKAVELFNEAAELAMAAMKGRLANKYYAMAEEVSSMDE